MTKKDTVTTTTAKKTATKNVAKATAKPSVKVNDVAAPAKVRVVKAQRKELDPHMFVTVRNGSGGRLVYKSRRTNEKFVWDGFGSEQDMELQELKDAKNSNKVFFLNNWFMIEDPEIVEYLGIGRLYENSLSYGEFDDIFEESPDAIRERVKTLPEGQKKTLAIKAMELVKDNQIDSIKKINAFEESLGIELIER